ncbi:MAG TPA: alpha/beta hydrolase [Propionicimonas sp.]|uniref:RBBP9/YdeN family alpha/beta hydrolase n=1 Tax=Propionicimonas sp. TaxID=1955623 RepID=UPI002F42D261
MVAFSGRYVIAPGYHDSDAGHWQTLWQADLGEAATRVAVGSWDEPELEDWVAALDAVMTPGALIVAHSLGCLTALTWLERHPGVAAGAFLVAVPDPEGPDFPDTITGFARPLGRSAEPLLIVGSTDDPFAGWDYTVATAAAVGAPLVELDAAGHISTASGRGPWPEGRALLAEFMAGLPSGG